MDQDRYQKSQEWRQRALALTPRGSQTRSKVFCDGAYPTTLTEGQGGHVWDVDGHEYIDWICALGAVSLGYAHPEVNQAVRHQLHQGVSFSLPHRIETEYAEELLAALAWPEQVRFVKTGSEATAAAVMMARQATGRPLVLSIGYHGWHAIHQPSVTLLDVSEQELLPSLETHASGTCVHCARRVVHHSNSIRSIGGSDRHVVADLHAVEDTSGVGLVECTNTVAAVLLEVGRLRHPATGWLQAVRAACTQYGVVMILDECVTGFRWAVGGAGAYYDVVPDLACFGKAMANGFPLAAIVGPRNLMEHAGPLVSSTFGGDAVALAAARATLHVYQREPVIETMWRVGTALQENFDVPGRRCVGVPVHPRIEPAETAFLEQTAARGVLVHPAGFNVAYAHTLGDVTATVEACQNQLDKLSQLCDDA